jgi:two-component system nitrate/nitrite response regulator NarL
MMIIVICDEHVLFGEAFAEAIREQGALPVVTARPADALAAFTGNRVNGLVMNMRSPDTSGLSVTRHIRSAWPETRIFCLGAEDAAAIRSCLEAGADLVLSKRQPLHELVHAVVHNPTGQTLSSYPSQTPDFVKDPAPLSADREPLAARFLTNREREVLRLLASAKSTRNISETLGISIATARGYIQSAFTKLGVHSRIEAVTYAIRHSLVDFAPQVAPTAAEAGGPLARTVRPGSSRDPVVRGTRP